jgi:hypothetical protein
MTTGRRLSIVLSAFTTDEAALRRARLRVLVIKLWMHASLVPGIGDCSGGWRRLLWRGMALR